MISVCDSDIVICVAVCFGANEEQTQRKRRQTSEKEAMAHENRGTHQLDDTIRLDPRELFHWAVGRVCTVGVAQDAEVFGGEGVEVSEAKR